MIVSTGIGSVYISPWQVIRSIFSIGDAANTMIVNTLRLPRIVVAVLVGASLAVSGALLQGVVRNPLASPDTIGITGGATLGAVTYFYFFSRRRSPFTCFRYSPLSEHAWSPLLFICWPGNRV